MTISQHRRDASAGKTIYTGLNPFMTSSATFETAQKEQPRPRVGTGAGAFIPSWTGSDQSGSRGRQELNHLLPHENQALGGAL
jgi:hypothetical protein